MEICNGGFAFTTGHARSADAVALVEKLGAVLQVVPGAGGGHLVSTSVHLVCSAGHCVATAGQEVANAGQTVATGPPVVLHAVSTGGHCVCVAGQIVAAAGQMVAVPAGEH